jgi:hypothetical protein
LIDRQEILGVKTVDVLKHPGKYQAPRKFLFSEQLSQQLYFKGVEYRVSGSLENTDRIMNQAFWLGVQPTLGEAHEKVANYSAHWRNRVFRQLSARSPIVKMA